MIMAKPRKKKYTTGDQLHFIITGDFVETANAFFDHCDAEMLNASSVIRRAMAEWLDRSGKGSTQESENGIVWRPGPETAQIQGHPGWIV